MNIRPSLGIATALLFATMFASCTKVELEAPSVKYGAEISFGSVSVNSPKSQTKAASDSENKVIVAQDPTNTSSFGLDLAVTEGIETPKSNLPATKGTQVAGINSFDVAAFYYADASQDGSLLFTETVTDGATGTTYYWPSFGTLNFVAVYPAGILNGGNNADNGNAVQTIADDSGNLQSFTYEIPSDIAQQQDVMVAVTKGVNNSETGAPVPMNFKHLLSAVRFKVGKMLATRINSLTLSGVKGGEVTISYDSESDAWVYEASSDNVSYSPIYTVDGAPNIDTYGLAEGNYITSNENEMVMFVMPQTLDGAKISINYTELITGTTQENIEAILPLHSWVAGQTNTYIININAKTLQITIPTPPDADAHYVRVDMGYDLSGLDNYAGEGITISNVTATTRWENDGSNTASIDKQSIYMKTTLSEMQDQEFFTDELWRLEYTVDDKGNKTYTYGSADGPEFVENILGADHLTLTKGGQGSIYLFLDENDGTTDRNGVLELKATVTQNGNQPKEVVLGSGKFKQLCPSWNTSGVGVERFEDSENTYPYGFSYNRIVTYTNESGNYYLALPAWLQALSRIFMWLFGLTTDTILPDTDGMAEGFVTVNKQNDSFGGEIVTSIILNYSALNNVSSLTNEATGLNNTSLLYTYTGEIDLNELEAELDKSLDIENDDNWSKDTDETTRNPEDYAAFIALTCNRMRELETIIHAADQPEKKTYKAILHRVGEGGSDGTGDETGAPIIEWYLPSSEEAKSLVETGTGLEATPISPLDGIYWSSTAGADPASGTNGYAYSYTYSKNTYSTVNPNEDRTVEHKVRAVRKKPTSN